MSSQPAVPTGDSAPSRAHLTWDADDGHEVLVGVADAVATLTAALEGGDVVDFPMADGATLLLNGAQLGSVIVGPARSGSPEGKHLGI